MKTRSLLLSSAFALLPLLGLTGCPVSLDGASCPCAEGNTCCPDNVCVPLSSACRPLGVLGTWQTSAASVELTVTFSGSMNSGTAELIQTTALSGDLPSCRVQLIGTGTFEVMGTSITIQTQTGKQRTTSCSFPDTETPIADQQPLMNFAMALSGPFFITKSQLKLGNSYPAFDRR